MAKTAKPKTTHGGRNDARPNGKAWKGGVDPATREAERKKKEAERRAKRESSSMMGSSEG